MREVSSTLATAKAIHETAILVLRQREVAWRDAQKLRADGVTTIDLNPIADALSQAAKNEYAARVKLQGLAPTTTTTTTTEKRKPCRRIPFHVR
jgi:hypothetical protein